MIAPLYTMDDIQTLLGIAKSSAYALKKKDGWPCVLVGSKVRFTDEHLLQIVQLYTRQPEQPKRAPRIGTRARRKS